ncbi:MAG: hypothetical protein IJU16_01105 [Clostridia bacterium]|nr:hypothetical protein [Clostridia bacterium]
MNHDRGYYRDRRRAAIQRKERLLREIGGESLVRGWAHGFSGRFAKGKIHCSCKMCRLKSCDELSARDKRWAQKAADQRREID